MAKKKNEQSLSGAKEETLNAKNTNGNKTDNKKASDAVEESHTGMTAMIIAVVALLVVGGSIGAFVLFLKAKNKYLDPLTQKKLENISSAGTNNADNSGLASQIPNISDEEILVSDSAVDVVGTSPQTASSQQSSDSQPPVYIPYTPPIVPEEEEEDEDAPELEEVDKYDFNSVITFADGKMNQVSEENMNTSWLKDSYFGF